MARKNYGALHRVLGWLSAPFAFMVWIIESQRSRIETRGIASGSALSVAVVESA
jgi:hypothetical protein